MPSFKGGLQLWNAMGDYFEKYHCEPLTCSFILMYNLFYIDLYFYVSNKIALVFDSPSYIIVLLLYRYIFWFYFRATLFYSLLFC